MTIAVGQILDKYELIEKVGQGGMAVVYKGLDQSLKRSVAVKVLHRHLAEHQEARDRFEREAHAVAKLHHENILEIFDFSGKDSDESYIVTEFIDGQTLREFISDHSIKYPEIGAMIVAQMCRALSHAHSLGVLHRDVKPENIMIRNDGVVKLTDFGIAHMLDARRMTVTGQLLGSPAYMSPEHVEGGQLDFRTDVFAVGIVLYQLVVGDQPFHGKNPHEILKRIAECKYVDPRQANPMVGNELGRIIRRAMARDPDDRYADITEMLAALEAYLTGSGLTDYKKELARFFEAPVAYELALRERLLAHLTSRGRELLPSDQVAALELFNRVLTIDPEHREVLATIDRLSRRRRGARAALMVSGVIVLAGLALAARSLHSDDPPATLTETEVQQHSIEPALHVPGAEPRLTVATVDGVDAASSGLAEDVAGDLGGADSPAGGHGDSPAPGVHRGDSGHGSDRSARPGAAGSSSARRRGAGATSPRDRDRARDEDRDERTDRAVEPGDSPSPSQRRFTLTVAPRKSEYRIGHGPWRPIDRSAAIEVGPGEHVIEVRNHACCQAAGHTISADRAGGPIHVTLGYLPASITPKCAQPGVSVQIDGVSARLGRKFAIPITGVLGRRSVKVTFIGERTDEHTLQLRYNESRIITCRFE